MSLAETPTMLASPDFAPRFQVIRPLADDDLPAIAASATPGQTIQTITRHHHQLARLLASGLAIVQVSALSGYSPGYISALEHDPAFMELLVYYERQGEEIKIDALARMRELGLASVDELAKRLAEAPDAWTKGELRDMAELMLVKPAAIAAKLATSATGGNGPPGAVTVNVKFVGASPAASGPSAVRNFESERAAAVDIEEIRK